ncbi:hypothetical protein KFK09_028564 [Dendrobium nobile]|uniref:CDC20/Fizzy WD40 domain-containing protein n=1 Tax=Dendrobium nobile TaxID=94219 RepID=A0A8T3A1X1_DENNO|nr:hypothetical protein KFK09_028564 [Dendrobium nobile]
MMDARAQYRHLGRFSSKFSSSRQGGGDRFIPNRSAMNLDIAHYLLMAAPRKVKENNSGISSSGKGKGAYREILDRVLLQNRTRILEFNSKPSAPTEEIFPEIFFDSPSNHKRPLKNKRYIPQSAEKVLGAPNIESDFYLNLLDWGKRNIIAVALRNSVYLWDASNGSTSKLVTFNDHVSPVSSVSWAPDGKHIALGLSNSYVQLWDVTSNRPLRTLEGIHQSRVGSLSWNGGILTTGGMDGNIVNNDVRIRSHIVQKYTGHHMEVCGLKWSGSANKLASGGNDNLVHVWDCSMAASTTTSNRSPWLHRFEEHTGAVKALAWCPFQRNLLAAGGGESDRCIRFWNTDIGNCLSSVDTNSQVSGLIWSKNERELLSSHGLPHNNLVLWRYPSMEKIVELDGHFSRVLFTTQSPDGCRVASAAGDETLRLWKIYETSTVGKAASKGASTTPFASFSAFTTIR